MLENLLSETAHWGKFKHFFKQEEIAARTILLREGDISRKAYFIEKGCLRLWFNNKGKDITFQFFFEGNGVSSVESFRTNQPSLFTLESIEPCIVHSIRKEDFTTILEESPEIKAEIEEHTFRRFIFFQQLFLSRIKDNPQKRYEYLLQSHPKILQRVPQHFIASYLGITPVSLSRIRNRK